MLEAVIGPGLGKRLQFSPDRVQSGLTEKHLVSLLGLFETRHHIRLSSDDLLAVYQSSDAVLTSQRGFPALVFSQNYRKYFGRNLNFLKTDFG